MKGIIFNFTQRYVHGICYFVLATLSSKQRRCRASRFFCHTDRHKNIHSLLTTEERHAPQGDVAQKFHQKLHQSFNRCTFIFDRKRMYMLFYTLTIHNKVGERYLQINLIFEKKVKRTRKFVFNQTSLPSSPFAHWILDFSWLPYGYHNPHLTAVCILEL